MIAESLNKNGYNFRERLNIYAGALLGATVPLFLVKYAVSSVSQTDSFPVAQEIIGWSAAIALNFAVPVRKVYSISELCSTIGSFVGLQSANRLREERMTSEKLEKTLTNQSS